GDRRGEAAERAGGLERVGSGQPGGLCCLEVALQDRQRHRVARLFDAYQHVDEVGDGRVGARAAPSRRTARVDELAGERGADVLQTGAEEQVRVVRQHSLLGAAAVLV